MFQAPRSYENQMNQRAQKHEAFLRQLLSRCPLLFSPDSGRLISVVPLWFLLSLPEARNRINFEQIGILRQRTRGTKGHEKLRQRIDRFQACVSRKPRKLFGSEIPFEQT